MTNEEKILKLTKNMSCEDLRNLGQKMKDLAEIKETKEKEIKQAFKNFRNACEEYGAVAFIGNESTGFHCINDPDVVLDLQF